MFLILMMIKMFRRTGIFFFGGRDGTAILIGNICNSKCRGINDLSGREITTGLIGRALRMVCWKEKAPTVAEA
jgi:hypothetical protein